MTAHVCDPVRYTVFPDASAKYRGLLHTAAASHGSAAHSSHRPRSNIAPASIRGAGIAARASVRQLPAIAMRRARLDLSLPGAAGVRQPRWIALDGLHPLGHLGVASQRNQPT